MSRRSDGSIDALHHIVVPAQAGTHYHSQMAKNPCVYILASRKHGTLYIGVTSNLANRLYQHVEGEGGGFTGKHDVKRLVYAEFHETMVDAIAREKQFKKWKRAWKVRLIEEVNPEWADAAADVLQ